MKIERHHLDPSLEELLTQKAVPVRFELHYQQSQLLWKPVLGKCPIHNVISKLDRVYYAFLVVDFQI